MRALLSAFVGYVVLSVVTFAVVVQLWLPRGIAAEHLSELAERDRTLLLAQDVIGTILGILAGYAACRLSGRRGLRNSCIVGLLFTAYGVLGIHLHPDHPILMQAAKLLTPIPLALLGGWLALPKTPVPGAGDDDA